MTVTKYGLALTCTFHVISRQLHHKCLKITNKGHCNMSKCNHNEKIKNDVFSTRCILLYIHPPNDHVSSVKLVQVTLQTAVFDIFINGTRNIAMQTWPKQQGESPVMKTDMMHLHYLFPFMSGDALSPKAESTSSVVMRL